MENLKKSLLNYKGKYANLLSIELNRKNVLQLDLSIDNPEIYQFDILDFEQLGAYIQGKIRDSKTLFAVGGYAEDRLVYKRSPHFGEGNNSRSIHLGIDIWSEPLMPVFAPLDAIIHSYHDNAQSGDYGPTIILEHDLGSDKLYTLYGHLSRQSLDGLFEGKEILAGEQFGKLGDFNENGEWPPHLHFQLIRDMKGLKGDFPGVCSNRNREYYMELCPDPNLLLNIN